VARAIGSARIDTATNNKPRSAALALPITKPKSLHPAMHVQTDTWFHRPSAPAVG